MSKINDKGIPDIFARMGIMPFSRTWSIGMN